MVSWTGTYTGGAHNFANGDTIDGNVIFNGGATVTVSAGATITVTGNYSVTMGQSASQASFTSNATGGSPSFFQSSGHDGTPRGDWVGFDFRESSGATLDHLRIRDTTTGIWFQGNEITSMTGYIGEDSFQCGLWDPAIGAVDQTLIGDSGTEPIIQDSREGIEIATTAANVVRLDMGPIKFEATIQRAGWVQDRAIFTGAGAVWHGGIWTDPQFLRWGMNIVWKESDGLSVIDEMIFSRGDTNTPSINSTVFNTIEGQAPGLLYFEEPVFKDADNQSSAFRMNDFELIANTSAGDIDYYLAGGDWEMAETDESVVGDLQDGANLHSITFADTVITKGAGGTGIIPLFYIDKPTDVSGGKITFVNVDTSADKTAFFSGNGRRDILQCIVRSPTLSFENSQTGTGLTIRQIGVYWTGTHRASGNFNQLNINTTSDRIEIRDCLVDMVGGGSSVAHFVIGRDADGQLIMTNNRHEMDSNWARALAISNSDTSVSINTGFTYRGNEIIDPIAGKSVDGISFVIGGAASTYADINGLFEHNLFRGLGVALLLLSNVANIDGGWGGRIFCNDFDDNDKGIRFEGTKHNTTTTEVATNFLGNDTFGLEVVSAQTDGGNINALLSYWDSTDGPSGVGPGSGDAVSANVDFIPFADTPCEAPAIIVGDFNLSDVIKDPLKIDQTLDKAWQSTFDVDDMFRDFTREGLGGEAITIRIGTTVVFRGWVEIATPRWRAVEARIFDVVALNAVGIARLKKIPNTAAFNYSTPTDPAQIFRDTIDDALALALPAEDFTHTIATIPDSDQLVVGDFREMPILDVWNLLRDEVGGRSFWIDVDNVVHFRESLTTAKTLEAEDVLDMTNPYDQTEVYNRITYRYDSLTKTVVPKPISVESLETTSGFRDWVEDDPDETDADSAAAKANGILARKSQILQPIAGQIDIDFFTYDLRDLIEVNVPIMELDGVDKEIVKIEHVLHLNFLQEDGGERVLFGETNLTLGVVPLRVSDIISSVNR